MKTSTLLLITFGFAALSAPQARAAELQPATLQAWDAYMSEVNARIEQRAASNRPFMWMDESPDRAARVRRGEVVVEPVVGRGTQSVTNGLIHDWIGAIFIPGATIASLSAVVHDYDHYERLYRPAVVASRSLPCAPDDQQFLMVFQHHVLFVNAAMQGQYRAHDVTVDSHRGYNVAQATEIRQIEGYGHDNERLLPPDTGSGFIWRIHSIARYEERDGGVYLEVEAIALTRDIPASLSWLVTGAVHHLSINSLTTTLRQTRDAVISSRMHGPTEIAAAAGSE
jgi:hypothetical protein